MNCIIAEILRGADHGIPETMVMMLGQLLDPATLPDCSSDKSQFHDAYYSTYAEILSCGLMGKVPLGLT